MTTCNHCGDTWGGQKTGHCTICHTTFSADSNFDKHLIIERGPGIYKVVGHTNPADVTNKHGERLLYPHTNPQGTTIWRGTPRNDA